MIINESGDSENYKIKISAINLFVPVAVIKNSIFAELNSILSKKDSTNPEDNAMSYHFRRIELKTFTILATTNDYQSDTICPDGNLPARLVIAFVNSKAKIGDYSLNPFYFPRHWDVPISDSFRAPEKTIDTAQLVSQIFDEKMSSFTKTITELLKAKRCIDGEDESQQKRQRILSSVSEVDTEATPHREKSPDSIPNASNIPIESNFLSAQDKEKVEAYIDQLRKRNRPGSATTDDFYQFEKEGEDIAQLGNTKRIFLRKLECTLNGNSIDQLVPEATSEDDMESFWRLFYFNNQMNTLISCGLTYEDFMFGSFFGIFDLS